MDSPSSSQSLTILFLPYGWYTINNRAFSTNQEKIAQSNFIIGIVGKAAASISILDGLPVSSVSLL